MTIVLMIAAIVLASLAFMAVVILAERCFAEQRRKQIERHHRDIERR